MYSLVIFLVFTSMFLFTNTLIMPRHRILVKSYYSIFADLLPISLV